MREHVTNGAVIIIVQTVMLIVEVFAVAAMTTVDAPSDTACG